MMYKLRSKDFTKVTVVKGRARVISIRSQDSNFWNTVRYRDSEVVKCYTFYRTFYVTGKINCFVIDHFPPRFQTYIFIVCGRNEAIM